MREFVEVFIAAALDALGLYLHELFFDFVGFVYFGETVSFEPLGVFSDIESF